MRLLSPAISRLARMRMWRIENWITHADEAQRHVLQHLVTSAQYTEFGKRHRFSDLHSIKEFKQAVPLQEYDDLKPYIQRMLDGEENVLWNEPISWFAKSSGTTSDKSKFIPVSAESLQDNHYAANKDVLTNYYYHYPDSDLLTGKGLVVGGSHKINALNDEVQYGDLSAVLMQNTPFWGNWLRTPELSIALMDNWDDKIEMLAQSTADENVTSLAGVPTWTLLLLKRILEIKKKSVIAEVWPNLELYLVGGVSFLPYRAQFDDIFGKPVNYVEVYNASEGFFAAQQKPEDDGMLLYTNHGIFYEFMPLEEYGSPGAKTIGLRQVEKGKNYVIIVTTSGGLWRYVIGDTIQFTSLDPYKIIVSGRTKNYINAFGEEIIINNADYAITKAAESTGSIVNDYTSAPIYLSENSNGAHEWLIEFDKAPESLDAFVHVLDEALQEINSDYEAKRFKSIALRLPVVQALPPGSFNRWLESKQKKGGQHKVPRLSNDRKVIDSIKEFLKL